jgi:hypothetical protein
MARTGWRQTDLSVYVTLPDGTRSYVYTMASGDRRAFSFDAEETVGSSAATLTRLDTAEALAESVENVEDTAEGATVTVSDLPADTTCLLAVTFTLPDSERRTRTLFLDVPV